MAFFLQFTLCGQNNIQNGEYFYHNYDDPTSTIDSIVFFYTKSGDTLTYYTSGGSIACNNKEFKKFENKKGYGKFIQKGPILSDGRTMVYFLTKNTFLIRNDSLFEWNETCRLSEDSIKNLQSIYELSQTIKEREKVSKIKKKNSSLGFVFIFSPSLFKSGIEQSVIDNGNSCPNMITLISKWSIMSTDYYRIEISNNCGIWGHRWGYVITNDFKFIAFGGYGSKELKYLTKENLVFMNQDK